MYACTYFGLDETGAVALEGAGQPHLEALGKVADGLGERSRDRSQHVWDKKVHDALVEEKVTGTDEVDHRLTAGEDEQLLLWELVFRLLFRNALSE